MSGSARSPDSSATQVRCMFAFGGPSQELFPPHEKQRGVSRGNRAPPRPSPLKSVIHKSADQAGRDAKHLVIFASGENSCAAVRVGQRNYSKSPQSFLPYFPFSKDDHLPNPHTQKKNLLRGSFFLFFDVSVDHAVNQLVCHAVFAAVKHHYVRHRTGRLYIFVVHRLYGILKL